MAVPHIIMAGIVGKFHSSWASHPGVGWFGVALICMLSSFSSVGTDPTDMDD